MSAHVELVVPTDTYPVAAGRCPCCGRTQPIWTPAAIIAALDRWHERYGLAPSSHEWRRASRENPTADQVIDVFGSFDAARAAAGLVYVRRNTAGEWAKRQILEAILRWKFLHGRPPAAHEWQSPPDGFPSTATVRRRFGSWNRAIETAGYTPRRRTVAA